MKSVVVYDSVQNNEPLTHKKAPPKYDATAVFSALSKIKNAHRETGSHEALETLRLAIKAARIQIVIYDYSAYVGRILYTCMNAKAMHKTIVQIVRLEALHEGKVVCLSDIDQVDRAHPLLALVSDPSTDRLMAVPLLAGSTLKGVLIVEWHKEYFQPNDALSILEPFAQCLVSMGLTEHAENPYETYIHQTYTTVREDFIIEASQIGTWEFDIASNVVSLNANLAKMLGFEDAGPMVYKRDLWETLVHEDDLRTAHESFDKVFKGLDNAVAFEHRLRHAKGHYIWVFSRGKVLQWNDRGQPIKMYGVHIDITEKKHALQNLKKSNDLLEEKVTKKIEEIQAANQALSFALARLTESRDYETGMHVDRVQHLCKALAGELSKQPPFNDVIDNNFLHNIFYASSIHDIGKVGIPDSILLKPGPLDDAERAIMQTHVEIGAEMLEDIMRHHPDNSIMQMGYDIVKAHHERWDGKGYPQGLKETEIPLSARIMAVVDAYDALRSKRPYQEAFLHATAVEIIKVDAGTHFDSDVVEAFLRIHDQCANIYDQYND